MSAAEKSFFEAAGSHRRHVFNVERVGQRRYARAARARCTGDPAKHGLPQFEEYWATRPHGAAEIGERLMRPRISKPRPLTRAAPQSTSHLRVSKPATSSKSCIRPPRHSQQHGTGARPRAASRRRRQRHAAANIVIRARPGSVTTDSFLTDARVASAAPTCHFRTDGLAAHHDSVGLAPPVCCVPIGATL